MAVPPDSSTLVSSGLDHTASILCMLRSSTCEREREPERKKERKNKKRDREREHVTSHARRVEVSFHMIGRKPAVKHLGVKPEGCNTSECSRRSPGFGAASPINLNPKSLNFERALKASCKFYYKLYSSKAHLNPSTPKS